MNHRPEPSNFSSRIKAHLAKYKLEALCEPTDGVYRRNNRAYPHILPWMKRELNLLSPFQTACWDYVRKARLKLHQDFHHLNSSQAMCFNLFFPIKNDPRTRASFLMNFGISAIEVIAEFEFEKVFRNELWHDGLEENTNFDCYLKLASGGELFFELKFSEEDFGRANANTRHRTKLARIYKPRLSKMVRPEFLTEEIFFRNYQLLRNISYLSDDHDTRLFLVFPRANLRLAQTQCILDSAVLSATRDKISIIHLEDLVDRILQSSICADPALQEHYQLFKAKYLPDWSCGSTERFLRSVLGTFFEDLEGNYISKVGEFWRDKQSIVIITAWNPSFKPASTDDNQRQNLALKNCLKDAGKEFEEILAFWPDRKGFERSFAVTEMTDDEARQLCIRFGQAAYFRAESEGQVELVRVNAAAGYSK